MENKKSPLSGLTIPNKEKTQDITIKKPTKKKQALNKKIPTPRSYRISYNELDILKDKTEEISEMVGTHVKITDTLVLRALIRMSKKIDNSDLYDEIKAIKIEM